MPGPTFPVESSAMPAEHFSLHDLEDSVMRVSPPLRPDAQRQPANTPTAAVHPRRAVSHDQRICETRSEGDGVDSQHVCIHWRYVCVVCVCDFFSLKRRGVGSQSPPPLPRLNPTHFFSLAVPLCLGLFAIHSSCICGYDHCFLCCTT